MGYIVSFLPFIFGRTTSPDSLGRSAEHEQNSKLPAAERRATADVATDSIKPLSQRELAVRANFLGRILTVLKYGPELEKAALNCKKFLISLSRPDFELSTAMPLLATLDGIGNPNFEKLFQETINDTLKKLAEEAKRSGRLAQRKENAENNLTHVFIDARKKCYGNAFRIAKEYKNALTAISTNQPVRANWTISVEPSSSKKQAKSQPAVDKLPPHGIELYGSTQ